MVNREEKIIETTIRGDTSKEGEGESNRHEAQEKRIKKEEEQQATARGRGDMGKADEGKCKKQPPGERVMKERQITGGSRRERWQ